ncbi:hypothetical protein BKA82DRAFT_1003179, partial [Pisolithus tinctorius]
VRVPRIDSESDSLPGMSFSKDWVRTLGSRCVISHDTWTGLRAYSESNICMGP